MVQSDFSISIKDDSVDVRYTPSARKPHGKLFGLIFSISMLVLFTCFVLFMPDKHGGPSVWVDLISTPREESWFVGKVIVILLFAAGSTWHVLRYARVAWASDEILHCDRKAITISRIPWLDFSNRTWRTQIYPLTEVRGIRFAVIASANRERIWGLRFRAHGRRWALPGLEATQAKAILVGLRALGADAPDDPGLDKKIKLTRQMQFGDTTWMTAVGWIATSTRSLEERASSFA